LRRAVLYAGQKKFKDWVKTLWFNEIEKGKVVKKYGRA
jgi:hypothetical protein